VLSGCGGGLLTTLHRFVLARHPTMDTHTGLLADHLASNSLQTRLPRLPGD
jgi:hypothetical protein